MTCVYHSYSHKYFMIASPKVLHGALAGSEIEFEKYKYNILKDFEHYRSSGT